MSTEEKSYITTAKKAKFVKFVIVSHGPDSRVNFTSIEASHEMTMNQQPQNLVYQYMKSKCLCSAKSSFSANMTRSQAVLRGLKLSVSSNLVAPEVCIVSAPTGDSGTLFLLYSLASFRVWNFAIWNKKTILEEIV